MSQFYINSEVPTSVALWLSYDEYDYINIDNYISVTNLLKHPRQAILGHRVRMNPVFDKQMDLLSFFSSRMGTALHASIDKAWDIHHHRGLKILGYPEKVIDNIHILRQDDPYDKPTLDALRNQGKIIVAKEIRLFKAFGPYLIGGKFDFSLDGEVEDFKSLKTYAYKDKDRLEKELMQISIYRWLNPDLLNKPTGKITQIYTDWLKSKAGQNSSDYPPIPIISKTFTLYSQDEVEAFISSKLADLENMMDLPEKELPRCTPVDLWETPSSFKYYSDPAKAKDPKARSTKNFDTAGEAELFRQQKGKGVVVHKLGQVKACAYCSGFEACTQKDEYIATGRLVVE